ncbi:hypothetical protein [Mesorhizobium sp. WSM4904]|uniref:hypothetical protein n=1 Tax=Mesorhizobium sp. WSM4904 TaxID=3038545 RepID=UPI0024181DB8|nr:hypothetical protein [Mesorhizobium sp. WSM4904]WFP62272.1 hypothetical protein QAZ47_28095 [Mesorhizobium sp. WSM4904]
MIDIKGENSRSEREQAGCTTGGWRAQRNTVLFPQSRLAAQCVRIIDLVDGRLTADRPNSTIHGVAQLG